GGGGRAREARLQGGRPCQQQEQLSSWRLFVLCLARWATLSPAVLRPGHRGVSPRVPGHSGRIRGAQVGRTQVGCDEGWAFPHMRPCSCCELTSLINTAQGPESGHGDLVFT